MTYRKGVLFSAGLILLSLTLLSLSFLLFTTNMESSSDTARMAVADRINDEARSIENTYSDILSRHVNVTINRNNVSFSETLPEGASSNFFTAISRFKTFAENNSEFPVDLTTYLLQNRMPLTVTPTGITYTHENDFGGNETRIANASSVTSYTLNITMNKTGTINLRWITLNEDAGGTRFSVEAKGLTGTSRYDSRVLSKTSVSELQLETGGTQPQIFVGSADDPGMLRVVNGNDDAMFLNITLAVNASKAVSVKFQKESINITSEEYNITMTSAISIR